jgi:hypothetical protein
MNTEKSNQREIITTLLVVIIAIIVITMTTTAEPQGPTSLTELNSERYEGANAYALDAQAGNVTELSISATTISRFWAGYYGNISGTVVLANANNNSLYEWNATNPQGEIYASRNSSLQWVSVTCADDSLILQEEIDMNMGTSPERINVTFQYQSHPEFYVGSNPITQNTCRSTNLYDNTGFQTNSFFQVLLMEGSTAIYTTIISPETIGFDGNEYDFQMIVPEDGSNANVDTTTYYFYVEIE